MAVLKKPGCETLPSLLAMFMVMGDWLFLGVSNPLEGRLSPD